MEIPVFAKERDIIRRFYGSRHFLKELEAFREKRRKLFILAVFLLLFSLWGGVPLIMMVLSMSGYLLSRDFLKMKKTLEKRHWELLREYPDFLMYVKLYLESNTTFSMAIYAYEERGVKSYYLNKLISYFRRIDLGESKQEVLTEAGQDLMEKELLRLLQFYNYYVEYGSVGLGFLEGLSEESIKLKKEEVKKRGEKASAKLVFPMMLIFLGILLLVLGPSILTLK